VNGYGKDSSLMLRWRLILGTLIIAALVAVCWLDFHAALPGLWLLPIAAIAAVLATKELLDLAALAQLRPMPCTVYFGNVLLVVGVWLVMIAEPSRWGTAPLSWERTVLLSLSLAVILVFLGEMWRYRKPGGNAANLAIGVFAVVYVGLMLSFAVQLRVAWGIGAMAAWVIVVKMGDTGAYTVGRLIGRHKMAPLISPGKTIEGALGALAFSCLGSWLAFKFLVPLTVVGAWRESGSPWGWIVFGILVGSAGMAGDLAESLLKRDVAVKDSSTWMPGFGGVLDILDSLLLSAPVAWFCWAFGVVG
jgi:phosphatidate cytidylyltransferase